MRKIKVLLSEADHRSTIAAVRAIGRYRAEFEVHVAGDNLFNRAFYSRYCSGRHLCSSPEGDESAFVESMLTILKGDSFDAVLPMGTASVILISKHREQFDPYANFAIPQYDQVMMMHDKRSVMTLCDQLDIMHPRTYYPENEEDIKVIPDSEPFPLVIKAGRGAASKGLCYAQNTDDLLQAYRMHVGRNDSTPVVDFSRPMVQQYIPGELHDLVVLFNHGELTAQMTQQRLKTLPLTGGGGIVNVTTKGRTELEEMGVALLKHVKWHGPAMIDFKVNTKTGVPYLLEVNPRFWGTTALSIEAGINFPLLTVLLACQGDVASCFEYSEGIMYRWVFPEEVLWMLKNPQRRKYIKEFFAFRKKNVYTNLVFRDPLPPLLLITDILYRLLTRKMALSDITR